MSTLSHAAASVNIGRELRTIMEAYDYPFCNISEAAAWYATHGTVAGCPVVAAEDVSAIDGCAAADDRREWEAEADRETRGTVECDPRDWPAWTDAYVWEPTEPPTAADRQWAAETSPFAGDGYTVIPPARVKARRARPRRVAGAASLAPHDDAEVMADHPAFGFANSR